MLLLLFLHVHYYCHLAIAFVSLVTTSTCLIDLIVMLSLYMCSTDRINKINEYDFLPSLFKVSLIQLFFTCVSCEEAVSLLRGDAPTGKTRNVGKWIDCCNIGCCNIAQSVLKNSVQSNKRTNQT